MCVLESYMVYLFERYHAQPEMFIRQTKFNQKSCRMLHSISNVGGVGDVGRCSGCGFVLQSRNMCTVCIVGPYQPFRIQGYIIHKHLTELPSRRLLGSNHCAGPGPLFYSLGRNDRNFVLVSEIYGHK